MNSNKTICLTFDWELFFRESGTPERCQLEPTDRLLNVSAELGIPLVFFVDVMHLWRAEAIPAEDARNQNLKAQVRRMVREGHRVELHLHPHWLDAEYRGDGQWVFPHYRRYRLQNLPDDQVIDLMCQGAEYLNKLCGSEIPGYKVEAFRAGGWCIQPFAPAIQRGFLRASIRIDSSVATGVHGDGTVHQFDFRKAPRENSWTFSDNPARAEPGAFIEIPISTFQQSFSKKLLRWKSFRSLNSADQRQLGDGKPMHIHTGAWMRWKRRLSANVSMYSLERTSVEFMRKLIKETLAERLVFISHTKEMSQSSLDVLRWLHSEKHSFVNLTDIASGENIRAKVESNVSNANGKC